MNKYCVATCIFNDYDLVREPLIIDNDCDYYLFTDNKNLTSDNWKIIYLENFDTNLLTGVQKTYMWKYSLYKYIPNLSNYDYIIRIDASILILNSLNEIIRQMREYKYDLSIGIHPDRNNRFDEYSVWEAFRNLESRFIEQYNNFVNDVMQNNNYYGLCENTVQIYKCNKNVFNLLDSCYAYINYYCNFEDANDQCYFSDILSFYINNLRIHWHSNKLYIDGKYLCLYYHNTTDICICEDNNEGVIFNRPIIIDNF